MSSRSKVDGRTIRALPLPGSPTVDAEIARGWLLAAAPNAEGWVETQSEVFPWRAGEELGVGRILRAEWADGEGRSARIMHLDGRWVGVELVEEDAADGVVVADEYLSTVALPSPPKVRYRTAWVPVTRDGISVLEPGLGRFVGWGRDDGAEARG